jgi:hypothetical protein
MLVRNNSIQNLNPVTPPLVTLFDPVTGMLTGEQLPQRFAYTFHRELLARADDGPLVLYQLSDPGDK